MELEEKVKELEKQLNEVSDTKKKLEASYERVLSESKTYKTRAQENEARLKELEDKKLEADGETQKLLERERERNSELTGKLKNVTTKAISEKLRAEVLNHAKDAHNVDMLLKVTDHKELLKVDEENLSVAGVEDFVKKARETHAYLFSNGKLPNTENKKPKGEDPDKDKIDMKNYAKELAAAKTQREFDEIRKKYGRA